MDPSLRHRLSGIVAARAERGAASEGGGREERLHQERRRLIEEIGKLSLRLSGAVAEINDELEASDLRLKIDPPPAYAAAEVIYRVGVFEPEGEEDFLDLAVGPKGDVHALLQGSGDKRRAIGAAEIRGVSREMLLDWLLQLLERRYGPSLGG